MGRWFASGALAPAALEHASPRALRWTSFAQHALQLAALLVAIHALAIEASLGLTRLLPGVGVVFAVRAWVPAAWKLWCFVLVSAGAFVALLGPAAAATVFALGALVFALCHLPIGVWWRAALLVAVGAALA